MCSVGSPDKQITKVCTKMVSCFLSTLLKIHLFVVEGVTTAKTEHGEILREPLTRSQVNRAQVAIRKLVNDHRTPLGHHPFNAGILRLSFHDCVGLLGCDGCINHHNRANSGKYWSMTVTTLFILRISYSILLTLCCPPEGSCQVITRIIVAVRA